VWFAFWGEVKSRPTYRRICGAWDRYYDQVVVGLCRDLVVEGGYTGIAPEDAAGALTSITTGLWLTCLVSPKSFDRERALAAVDSYLRHVFPRHFPERQA
jgi:TetR/AcrR family transcriptional repressor of bet genes